MQKAQEQMQKETLAKLEREYEKLREDLENQIALGCLLRLTVGLHGATKAFLH